MSPPLHEPVRVLLFGAGGRMGRAVLALMPRFPGLRIEAAVTRRTIETAGDIVVLTADRVTAAPAFDVAIDFSLPTGFDALIDVCRHRGAALVSGTTGLSMAQRSALDAAAAQIPVLWASNFSPGVAVLERLVEIASAALPDWDCEILDIHHRHKRDAPSGTAVTLAEAVQRGRAEGAGWLMRQPGEGRRQGSEVGIASQRAGEVVGEHTVSLFGAHERLQLAHRAEDRGVFAYGALVAAQRIAGRPAGSYRLADLLLPSA